MAQPNLYKMKISGMTCDSCVRHAKQKLEKVPSVESVQIDSWQDGNTEVVFANGIDAGKLVDAIAGAGYRAEIINDNPELNATNSTNKQQFVILGGGSAAFAAAIKANELGASVKIINDGLPIGGTCVNVGCVPSKTLLRAAEAYHKAAHHPFSGIQSTSRITDFKALMQQKQDLVLDLRQAKYVDIVKDLHNIEIINGRARLLTRDTVEVNGRKIPADKILIATGAAPALPDVPGLEDVDYLTNESAFELEKLPESLIVLGGRYVALELAQLFNRFGSKVTVLQRSARILPTETAELTDTLSGFLREEGMEIITGVKLQAVEQSNGKIRVIASINGEEKRFEAEKVLVATGRKPNTKNMGLEETGVKLNDRGFLLADEHLQTSVPGIYGAGDVLGENMFVYTAAYEGKLAAENALQAESRKRNYTALPWVVFTDPQVAGVGMDEQQAQDAGIDFDTAILPLEYIPRSLAARDTRGFIKLIRNKSNDGLIGARILAAEGSELLMQIATAIRFNIKVSDLRDMLYPYLTLSEGIKLAAIAFDKDVKELSCCAT